MQITEFQRWVEKTDNDTQWNLLTTLQILSHLTEEVGEVAQSINRIYGYEEEREEHLVNLGRELMDAFWLLCKIANRFNVDLDAEAQRFAERMSSWSPDTVERHRQKLIAGLETLDKELVAAKRGLNLD